MYVALSDDKSFVVTDYHATVSFQEEVLISKVIWFVGIMGITYLRNWMNPGSIKTHKSIGPMTGWYNG